MSTMPRLIVCAWGLGVSLEKAKSLNPGLPIPTFKGIIPPHLDRVGNRTPHKTPLLSAWMALPSYGSMHFFPQAKEQHLRCSSQLKSVLHKSGALELQVILSWRHFPGFSVRKKCWNSHLLRVSALIGPWKKVDSETLSVPYSTFNS